MGRICYLCRKKVDANRKISLHKFPANSTTFPKIHQQWFSACGLSEVDDVSYIYICSHHFEPKDIILIKNRVKLQPGAVPTIAVPNPLPMIMNNENDSINPMSSEQSVKESSVTSLIKEEIHISEYFMDDGIKPNNEMSLNCEAVSPIAFPNLVPSTIDNEIDSPNPIDSNHSMKNSSVTSLIKEEIHISEYFTDDDIKSNKKISLNSGAVSSTAVPNEIESPNPIYYKHSMENSSVTSLIKEEIHTSEYFTDDDIKPNSEISLHSGAVSTTAVPNEIESPNPIDSNQSMETFLVTSHIKKEIHISDDFTDDDITGIQSASRNDKMNHKAIKSISSVKLGKATANESIRIQSTAQSGNIDSDGDQSCSTSERLRSTPPRCIRDILTTDVATPRRARRIINMVNKIDQQKSKEIKRLRDINRNLRKRITSMKLLLSQVYKKPRFQRGRR